MPQTVDSNAADLEQITARLHNLERRVSALEGQAETSVPRHSPATESFASQTRSPNPPTTWLGISSTEMPGVVPVLGKAVLGIAGAYLLRAIAEAGPISKLPVLIAAMTYAALWMVWAVRTHDTNRFASATYVTTSILILAPLLWESTVRFQVITPAFAATVLVAFTVLSLTLAWRQQLQVIPSIAILTALTTAVALIIATRDLVPLTAAMLAVAAITEIAACLKHHLRLRFVPALGADFAVWLLIDVMTSAGGVPEGYHPTSAVVLTILCSALLIIYGGSIGVLNFGLRKQISVIEIIQGVFAFALAAFGILRANPPALSALGIFFLLLAGACYWGALSLFADESFRRNRRVSATWAAALLLAGAFLVFSAKVQVLLLCLAALAAACLYSYTRKFSMGLHASFYLAAATAVSPLPVFGASALAGAVPSALNGNVWLVGIVAFLCYLVGARIPEARIQRRGLWVVPVALSGFASASIVVVAVCRFRGQEQLDPSHLSVIRTIVSCVLALVLGFAGSRWRHAELRWVAYAAVALGTLKLLLEDLRFGNAGSLVISLLCYGTVLILLPRFTLETP
ncbi:MAG TPA: hypothetical protein VE866_17075 [Candidatus Binatia bacterium]|nr:hypothetical protein [Candidatus Binatia bacterium]